MLPSAPLEALPTLLQVVMMAAYYQTPIYTSSKKGQLILVGL